MSVFRICDLNYTSNSEIQYLLDEREEILKLELKVQEQELRSQPSSPAAVSSPAFAAPVPTDSDENAAAAMYALMARPTMVASSSSSSMPSSSRFMGVNLASIPESSAHQHTYAGVSSSAGVDTPSAPVGAPDMNLDTSDIQANMAMISDGSRYSGGHQVESNQLPPYSPGNQPTMNGHGNENNDTRLSEYVKGQTRAQDMKDGETFQ